MSIKLRAWDHFNDEMIYSDKFGDLYDFFYDVKRRENCGNKVSLMLASNQWVHADDPIYEGDIIRFHYGAGDEIKTGIVECRPEHYYFWQVKVIGDRYALGWATNCCTGMQVIGNRYADREWLEDEGLGALLDEAEKTTNPWFVSAALKKLAPTVAAPEPKKEEIFADEPGVPIPTPKPARLSTYYQDDFNHTIKEGDILAFNLCGRQFVGEVKRIWSDDRYYWQVWTYESPEMKLSLRHMCEDIACTEVRVIGHISTVRRGGVTVQDIGIQL
jgi:hypothetical protein